MLHHEITCIVCTTREWNKDENEIFCTEHKRQNNINNTWCDFQHIYDNKMRETQWITKK